jgi:RNA polymerase sigma-70 factor (ECF subfamily)
MWSLFLFLLALPDLPEEDRLLTKARRGDQNAIAEIYERYFDAVYQFIRWRVSDPAQAEDLTSEVFIKFLSALNSPHAPRQSVRGWLFRVARNLLYDHYARRETAGELDDDLPIPTETTMEDEFMRHMEAERIQRFLRRLAADQQEVLILRFGQMLSLQDTAEVMGKSVSAIKSLQFRAIDTLRRLLTETEAEARHGVV